MDSGTFYTRVPLGSQQIEPVGAQCVNIQPSELDRLPDAFTSTFRLFTTFVLDCRLGHGHRCCNLCDSLCSPSFTCPWQSSLSALLPPRKKKMKKEHIPVWKFVYSWGRLGYFGGGRVEKRLFLSAEPQRRPSDMFWPSRERSGQES